MSTSQYQAREYQGERRNYRGYDNERGYNSSRGQTQGYESRGYQGADRRPYYKNNNSNYHPRDQYHEDKYRNQHREEQVDHEYYSEEEEHEEDDTEKLTEEQERFITAKQFYCKNTIPVLKMDEVAKICIDFDFEEEKIDDYLKCFEVDEKYKGIPAYEWHETKTREQKTQERRKKFLEELRIKKREERIQAAKEERERRQAERLRKAEERKKYMEEKRLRRKEQNEQKEKEKDTGLITMQKGKKVLVFKKKTEGGAEESKESETTEVKTAETQATRGGTRSGKPQYQVKGGKQVWKPKSAQAKPEEHIESEEKKHEEEQKHEETHQETTSAAQTEHHHGRHHGHGHHHGHHGHGHGHHEDKHQKSEKKKVQHHHDDDDADTEDLLRKAVDAKNMHHDESFNKSNQQTPMKESKQESVRDQLQNLNISQPAQQPVQQPAQQYQQQTLHTNAAQFIPKQKEHGQQPGPQQVPIQPFQTPLGLQQNPLLQPNPYLGQSLTVEQQQLMMQQFLYQQQLISQLIWQQQQLAAQNPGQAQMPLLGQMPFGMPPMMPFVPTSGAGVQPVGAPQQPLMFMPPFYQQPFVQPQVPTGSEEAGKQNGEKKKE